MRFGLTALAVAAALFLVGVLQLTRADSTAASQHILTFQEVGGSGIAGTVTLTAVGSDVEVVVDVTGLVASNTYISGAYNSTSVTCVGGLLGSFSSSFPGTASGVTYTVPNTTIPDIFSASVRDVTETGSPPGTVVACAERAAVPTATPTSTPAAALTATPTPTTALAATPTPTAAPTLGLPTTGGLPPTGDGATTGWYLLIAAGALTLVGGGTLTLRLRQQR
jgi:hypothetical protein